MGEVITVGLDIATKAFLYAASIMPLVRRIGRSALLSKPTLRRPQTRLPNCPVSRSVCLPFTLRKTACNYVFAKGD